MKEGFDFVFGEKTDFDFSRITTNKKKVLLYYYTRTSGTSNIGELWVATLDSPHDTDHQNCRS